MRAGRKLIDDQPAAGLHEEFDAEYPYDVQLLQNRTGDFARLRATLKPLVGDMMERVVFVSYGHPALRPEGGPCPGGRGGFDIHPAFGVDAERLRRIATFVQDKFLPGLKAMATCAAGGTANGTCSAADDAMTFVRNDSGGAAQFVELLAERWTHEQILSNYPQLTEDDIQAALHYAADTLRRGRVYPLTV